VGTLNLTAKQLEAVVRLRGNADFTVFMEVVREHERGHNERLVGATETPHVFRAQGAVGALRMLAETVDTAPETIRKLAGK
jgi:hypothetical protein